jgi:nucleotide-binding universal stress UspA family protein
VSDPEPPILVCYDRSDPARAAVEEVARLFSGRAAVVLTVFESVESSLIGEPLQRFELAGDVVRTLEEAAHEAADEIAGEGAELARAEGLRAEPLSARWRRQLAQREPSGVAEVISGVAEERGVAAVALGSRGATAVSQLALGSVAYGVLHTCSRPVLLVPGGSRPPARPD